LVLAGLSWVSIWVSGKLEVNGAPVLAPMMVGIVLGALGRNLGLVPKVWEASLKKFETPLLWGIILLGAGFSWDSVEAKSLIVIVVTMVVGFLVTYWIGRRMNLSERMSALLAVGTTICGGTAIAVTGPLIHAKEEETSYAVSTIVIAAFVVLLALPFLGRAMGMEELPFGVWSGTTVHNTPQTIATGQMYGELSGQTATVVKLTRNLFLIAAAFGMVIWFGAKQAATERVGMTAVLKAFPWFLFGYVVMAACAEHGFFTPEGVKFFKKLGKFLILMGMVGIGFGTDFRQIRALGVRPLLVGTAGTLVVGGVSLGLIKVLGF
jgi:uncharacterized integral membrane protein (TIGR00698 family)